MDIVNPEIDRYLHDLSRSGDPVLGEMEVLAAEKRFPIVGPQVGRLLLALARSCRALWATENPQRTTRASPPVPTQ